MTWNVHLRTVTGPEGPLVGTRMAGSWAETVRIAGFSRDCAAWQTRISALVVPGDRLVEHRTQGRGLA